MDKDNEDSLLTRIFLDEMLIDYTDTENDAVVGDLVGAIEAELKSQKRIVSGLKIESEPLLHWRSEDFMARKLSDFKELSFISEGFDEFAAAAVGTLQEYIKVMVENTGASVAVIRRGGGLKPELLVSIFEGLVQIMATIDELSRGMAVMGIRTFKEDPLAYYAPLLEQMEELEQARSRGDSLVVADILEYEILPILADMDDKLFHSGQVQS